jgi:hypothetical protein
MGSVNSSSPEHNWYNWNIANWGTKWDAYETILPDGQEPIDIALVSFNTAWGPPIDFFLAWSIKYPDFEFDVVYEIEGEGPGMPHLVFSNGEMSEREEYFRQCPICGERENECVCDNEDEEYLSAAEANKQNSPCPQSNDISDDCKNCILGTKCHWDGKDCVDR